MVGDGVLRAYCSDRDATSKQTMLRRAASFGMPNLQLVFDLGHMKNALKQQIKFLGDGKSIKGLGDRFVRAWQSVCVWYSCLRR